MSKQTDANGRNVYTQQQLQDKLTGTYWDLIANAKQFGITGGAADGLARDVLGIPKGVNINTWMSDYAKKMAEQTTNAVNAIPSTKTVTVIVGVNNSAALDPKQYGNAVLDAKKGPVAYATGGRVAAYATGGQVDYLASGGFPRFRPIGTDTVPAMLTPGEFVIKKRAALDLGYNNLHRANTTGTWPGGVGSTTEYNVNYNGPVQVTDLDALMHKQDTARRDALAILDGVSI
jgi:hypothetical protein